MTRLTKNEKYDKLCQLPRSIVRTDQGRILGHVVMDTEDNLVLISPSSGANIRAVSDCAVSLKEQYTDQDVEFEFSNHFIPVHTDDTITDLVIRFFDALDHRTAGHYLKLTGEAETHLVAEMNPLQQAYIQLFDVLINAVRLSRQNNNVPIAFEFGPNTFKVTGKDQAELIEQSVPERERVINIPRTTPRHAAAPEKRIGKF